MFINIRKLPLWMAWFWAVNLVFFPAWLFGNVDRGGRLLALLLTLVWIAAGSIILHLLLKMDEKKEAAVWNPPPINRRHLFILGSSMLLLLVLNVIPATYRLTSSGDEAAHAGTFRGIGRNAAAIFSSVSQVSGLPGWLLVGAALLMGALACWLLFRFCRSRQRRGYLLLALFTLVLVPLTWLGVDHLAAAGTLTSEELAGLVRFPPLSKFIWLPFSLLGWESLFVLRLPSLICWLLSALVMYRVATLRWQSALALLPPLLLACIPGYFYYGHLVYLTSPMLLAWCLVLYFYICYRESDDRRYLILVAVTLNIGTILRVETSYLTLAILAHYLLVQLFQKNNFRRQQLVDMAAVGWMGVSFIPLWGLINPAHRPFFMVWRNLTTPRVLLAVANDYPLHIGLLVTAALLVSILVALWHMRKRKTLSGLPLLCLLMMVISYLLYTLDYMMVDYRMVGLFAFGREWQTANRFLVSWSPFVALLLTEGIGHIPWQRLRLPAGLLLVAMLLAQATFWAAPFTLPEFTSIRLRPGAEYPHLPEREVLAYVSEELASPQTRILLSPHLAAGYFLDARRYPGDWQPVYWAPYEEQTLDGLVSYCRQNEIDIVVLPLVWMNLPGTQLEVSRAAMNDPHFEVKRVFDYLGQPAILVAQFVSGDSQ